MTWIKPMEMYSDDDSSVTIQIGRDQTGALWLKRVLYDSQDEDMGNLILHREVKDALIEVYYTGWVMESWVGQIDKVLNQSPIDERLIETAKQILDRLKMEDLL